MNKDSKIYIAGHRGLVGSAILDNLKSKGYTNFVTRTHAELDLTNQLAVADFFTTEKPDYVFLAAAKVGGIVANNTYRAEFIYDNLMIQNNVIHQSYVHGVKKLLFLGSTCIYPKNCPQPMKEEYLLTDTLEYTNEPYAIAKIAGIKLCESYNIQYGTNFIAVQPTNLYGPNDNFDLEKSHVLPALIRKIHLGKALEEDDWETICKDLNRLPIEGITGESSEKEIITILEKFGVRKIESKSHFDPDLRPEVLGSGGGEISNSASQIEVDTDYRVNLIEPDSHFDRMGEIPKGKKQVEVEIWGSGKPMREFLWSEDMADACVHIMERVDFNTIVTLSTRLSGTGKAVEGSISSNNEIRNTHINIGTGKEISIKELAETIKTIIGFKGSLYFNKNKPDGTMRKLTDTTKLHNLGWMYKKNLESGIKDYYSYFLTTSFTN